MTSNPLASALVALALVIQTACSKSDAAGASNPPGSAATTAGAPAGAPARGGPPAVVLGPTDVADVRQGLIEDGMAISGDLKPIEEIVVRARVEGDVTGAFVREGDRVTRGQLLATFQNAVQEGERTSSAADVESAMADVANAEWNADQSAELFKAGAVPERDLRTAQQALSAARARLAATQARLKASMQVVEDTRIVAPTTGVVSARSIDVGEHVARGAPVYTVVRNDVLELEAHVPAREASALKVSQAVRFTADGRQLEGRVARIAPTINAANRSITVYVQVPNRDGSLKGNTFATGRIIGNTLKNAIIIPNSAVRQSAKGDKPFVFRVEGDRIQHQDIELGYIDETLGISQVLNGLAAGQRIVVGNVGALGNGMLVRIASPEQQMRGRGVAGAIGDGATAGASATPKVRADSSRPR